MERDSPSPVPLIAGAIAGVVPFVMSSSTANVSWVNGEVVSATFRDWTAIGCGIGAALCGLAAIAMFASAKRVPLVIAGVAIVALGGYQTARGFGMFYKPEKPAAMAIPRDPPPPKAKDPATCPDRDACDNLSADLKNTDVKAARIARARSCDFGADYACEEAAEMWQTDDPAKARAFYEKACNLKNGSSCNELAVFYLGEGAGKDEAKGKAYLDKACALDHGLGCKNLSIVYRDGKGTAVDLAKSLEAAVKACAVTSWTKGDEDALAWACNYAGSAYLNGKGAKADKKAAVEQYTKACDRAPKYCFNLAASYNEGLGVKKDLARARELYTMSCDAGSPDACNNLGDMLNRGEGGPKDKAKAKELFQKACDGEVALGCKNLKGMK